MELIVAAVIALSSLAAVIGFAVWYVRMWRNTFEYVIGEMGARLAETHDRLMSRTLTEYRAPARQAVVEPVQDDAPDDEDDPEVVAFLAGLNRSLPPQVQSPVQEGGNAHQEQETVAVSRG